MNKQRIFHALDEIEAERIPGTTDLWPALRDRLEMQGRGAGGRQKRVQKAALLAGILIPVSLALIAVWFAMRPTPTQPVAHMVPTSESPLYSPTTPTQSLPFAVFQPGSLPVGFTVTTDQAGPGLQPAVQVYSPGQVAITPGGTVSNPFTVLKMPTSFIQKYIGPDGQYFSLSERMATPNEPLPNGGPTTISGQPAIILTTNTGIKVVWMVSGTRIELEGNLSEAELLHIAENLVERR